MKSIPVVFETSIENNAKSKNKTIVDKIFRAELKRKKKMCKTYKWKRSTGTDITFNNLTK